MVKKGFDLMENKLELVYVKCIKTIDDKFIVGKCYPVISYNNGWSILGERLNDDYFITEPLHNYGDVLLNPDCEDGKEYYEFEYIIGDKQC
jgi:hypothetical protein